MIAKSIKGTSTGEIQKALEDCLTGGYAPTLAFLFLSIHQDREAICTLLDSQGIAIFGATTSAEFSEKGVETEGIVILLLDINPAYFRIVLKDFGTGSVYTSATEVGQVGMEAFSRPAFIISVANFLAPSEEVIMGLVDQAGEDVLIAGGVSGEPVHFQGFVCTNNASSSNGLLALIIDQDKIAVRNLAVSGWKPVGTLKTVTKSEGSWVYTIDDKPAAEVIRKFIGDDLMMEDKSAGMVKLNMTYPLQFNRPGGSPKMLPAILLNTEDRSVMIGGGFAQGACFRFSLPPDFEVVDMVIESSTQIREREFPEADALVVFSCVGRLESLGPMSSMEVEGLAGIWHAPMAGFFSLGEFGTVAAGKPEFHGTTVSWVALKEI
jgi:hypothetical protein